MRMGVSNPDWRRAHSRKRTRSEEHTSELQSQSNLVCRLLLEKKKKTTHVREHYTIGCGRRHGAVSRDEDTRGDCGCAWQSHGPPGCVSHCGVPAPLRAAHTRL